eukprot:1160573-Pelagomonas_calceolata.AAC.26
MHHTNNIPINIFASTSGGQVAIEIWRPSVHRNFMQLPRNFGINELHGAQERQIAHPPKERKRKLLLHRSGAVTFKHSKPLVHPCYSCLVALHFPLLLLTTTPAPFLVYVSSLAPLF